MMNIDDGLKLERNLTNVANVTTMPFEDIFQNIFGGKFG